MDNYKPTKEEILISIGVIATLGNYTATRQTCDLLRELYDQLDEESN